jgi:hypothetical protein
MSTPVEVSIKDHQGGDQAPSLKKMVENIGLCPDQTHLRIYFDKGKFVAVPVTATVTHTENEWVAFDHSSELEYVMRKVENTHE